MYEVSAIIQAWQWGVWGTVDTNSSDGPFLLLHTCWAHLSCHYSFFPVDNSWNEATSRAENVPWPFLVAAFLFRLFFLRLLNCRLTHSVFGCQGWPRVTDIGGTHLGSRVRASTREKDCNVWLEITQIPNRIVMKWIISFCFHTGTPSPDEGSHSFRTNRTEEIKAVRAVRHLRPEVAVTLSTINRLQDID